MASALLRLGVQRGDRVALLFANGPELVFSYFACFKAGAVAVPVNTRYQVPEIVYVLNHSEARALIGQADLCAALLSRRADLPHLAHVYVDGEAAPNAGTRPYAELCRPPHSPARLPALPEDQLAALFYTSGTTARPKGVMHTHATLQRLSANLIAIWGSETLARTVIALPLCHMAGFGCQLLPALQTGGTAWLLPRFEPETMLRLLAECRATHFIGMPVHLNALLHSPQAEHLHLPALRQCAAGGDSVPLELQRRFKARFGVELDEVCGMTEVIYSANRPPDIRRAGSIGRPIGDVRLRLVDTEGREVAPGEVGEIVAQSGAMTPGYWNDPDATAAALQNGWLHTGDLALQDEDGYYWFVGRKKDIIIRGGSNISPAEVEEALYTHSDVYEAGVIGIPDPILGEVVRAYVALKPGAQATEAALRQFLGERLAAYKVPERIFFLPELPKGPTGKIHRQTLRERAGNS
jgi:acyl-CoA synthetase (AMP-forming)/AMP-acid ligase II